MDQRWWGVGSGELDIRLPSMSRLLAYKALLERVTEELADVGLIEPAKLTAAAAESIADDILKQRSALAS